MTAVDSYGLCVAAWATALRTLTTFFKADQPWQVTIADDSKLGQGADYFAIINAGTFPPPISLSAQEVLYNWQIPTDLYARYKDEADTTTRLLALRAAVLGLANDRDLLKDVAGVMGQPFITANEQMQYVMSTGTPNAGPVFKLQKVLLMVPQCVDMAV